MQLETYFQDKIKIESCHIASAISELNSREFCYLMEAIFYELREKCDTNEKYQSQLCWIASYCKSGFKEAITSLNDYLALDKESVIAISEEFIRSK